MKVQEGHIPAYLVVAFCTSCERRTLTPYRAMVDRYGSVITDTCGSCAPLPQDEAPQDEAPLSRGKPPLMPHVLPLRPYAPTPLRPCALPALVALVTNKTGCF